MNAIMGVARADFLERYRRFSFVAMMALALFAAFWFVPKDGDAMQVMLIQPDRFIQAGNPSWIPVASAWGLGFFLPLIGFFYLRNAVSFDERAGVMQFIASSPIGKVRYLLGKWLSGTGLLYSFTAVVMLGSFFMMLWHFPGQPLPADEFLTPFAYLIFALPLCSAVAVFFDSTRLLRGAFGSVIYIAAFITLYVLVSEAESPGLLLRAFDFSGTSIIFYAIARAVQEQSGQPMDILLFMGGYGAVDFSPDKQLIFHGIRFSAADLQGFAGMAAVTFGLVLLSAPVYHLLGKLSFDRLPGKRRNKKALDESTQNPVPAYMPAKPVARITAGRGIIAELRLMLAGQPIVWMLISIGALTACLFMDMETVQVYVMPLLMLWFINVFSSMGSREYQHGVLTAISVMPNGRLKQVLFSWMSGICMSMMLTCPILLRMLFAGQVNGVGACLAGAIFIPSFALFMGEFTRTKRVFEMSFIVWTYIILNDATAFMYMGIHPEVVSLTRSGLYLAAGVILGIASVFKRVHALKKIGPISNILRID